MSQTPCDRQRSAASDYGFSSSEAKTLPGPGKSNSFLKFLYITVNIIVTYDSKNHNFLDCDCLYLLI